MDNEIILVLMAFAFGFGVLLTCLFLSGTHREEIRKVMKRQKLEPNFYEANSDRRTLGVYFDERAELQLPQMGYDIETAQNIGASLFNEAFRYNLLLRFCDIARQCACIIYIKPDEGAMLSIDDIRGGEAPRNIT